MGGVHTQKSRRRQSAVGNIRSELSFLYAIANSFKSRMNLGRWQPTCLDICT